jgi:hypothetical protein
MITKPWAAKEAHDLYVDVINSEEYQRVVSEIITGISERLKLEIEKGQNSYTETRSDMYERYKNSVSDIFKFNFSAIVVKVANEFKGAGWKVTNVLPDTQHITFAL